MDCPLVYHPAYQAYDFGPRHPFSPVRLERVWTLLEALGAAPEPVAPPAATPAEVRWVHDDALVAQVEAASDGAPRPDAPRYGLATPDVPAFEGMDAAARLLVGGTLHAARLVASGAAVRVLQLGGGLHHAQQALASGFCVYNDLAVAIHHLRREGLRVAYLDVDVHHGDGVQWLFYEDPDVLTISLHESGRYLFPGTGGVFEMGEDAGTGYALNVPLEPFTQDASYLDVFERVVPHALAWFRPDVLVVQCGADAHAADPLAHLLLTTHGYEALFRRILALADVHTGGRLVLTLGGGYDLDATTRIWTMLALLARGLDLPERLPETWLHRWTDRQGGPPTPTLHDPEAERSVANRAAIEDQNRRVSTRLLELAAPYWH
ncbi:MAG: acetoin utilization protein AcuC [Rhodothermales bacterium]|nr:acetoin utilization protein AcuC [Rhodothermales bacterium]